LTPFSRAMLSAKRFIAGVGGLDPASSAIEAPSNRGPPMAAPSWSSWRFVDDEVLRERLKQAKGIGTPATRAEIIGGLKKQTFLIAQGKNIVPTETGLSLFGILKQADPSLVDPGLTAQLECLTGGTKRESPDVEHCGRLTVTEVGHDGGKKSSRDHVEQFPSSREGGETSRGPIRACPSARHPSNAATQQAPA
jgi:DNA topoisomerase